MTRRNFGMLVFAVRWREHKYSEPNKSHPHTNLWQNTKKMCVLLYGSLWSFTQIAHCHYDHSRAYMLNVRVWDLSRREKRAPKYNYVSWMRAKTFYFIIFPSCHIYIFNLYDTRDGVKVISGQWRGSATQCFIRLMLMRQYETTTSYNNYNNNKSWCVSAVRTDDLSLIRHCIHKQSTIKLCKRGRIYSQSSTERKSRDDK